MPDQWKPDPLTEISVELQNLKQKVAQLEEDAEIVPVLKADVNRISQLVDDYRRNHVSRDSFIPVRNIVYGMVSAILFGVMGAILALVFGHSVSMRGTP